MNLSQQNSKLKNTNLKLSLLSLVFAFLVFSATNVIDLNAQIINNKGSQAILKGKVLDYYTGSPVECEMEFKVEGGNKVKIKSNSITGEYEQLFNVGDKLKLTFIAYNVLKQEETIEITKPNNDNFEQKQDFKVKKLVEGKIFDFADAFSNGDNSINANGKSKIEELKTILRFNRGLSVNIEVNADDTYSLAENNIKVETYNELNEKGKKKSKKEIDAMNKRIAEQKAKLNAAESQNQATLTQALELSNKRKSAVEEIISTFKGLTDRIKVTAKSTLGTKNSNDLNIIIDKVENKLN